MKEKRPPRPRMELQAHLVATRITPAKDVDPGSPAEPRAEGPQDIMAIIERELAKIQTER